MKRGCHFWKRYRNRLHLILFSLCFRSCETSNNLPRWGVGMEQLIWRKRSKAKLILIHATDHHSLPSGSLWPFYWENTCSLLCTVWIWIILPPNNAPPVLQPSECRKYLLKPESKGSSCIDFIETTGSCVHTSLTYVFPRSWSPGLLKLHIPEDFGYRRGDDLKDYLEASLKAPFSSRRPSLWVVSPAMKTLMHE